MKTKLILVLCIAALTVCCLASCKTCEHTFSDKWYSDTENHWHPATCEHAETERSELAPHVDSDENGFCDVCEYEAGHTHSYANDWQSDDDGHWKELTCTHAGEKGLYSPHSDEDIDSVCDVCLGHVHSVNAAGYCKYTDCGEKVNDVDESDITALLLALTSQSHLINGGNVNYNFTGRSGNAGVTQASSVETAVQYIFGKDGYTYSKTNQTITNNGRTLSDIIEGWYEPDGVDSAFGIVKVNNDPLQVDSDATKLYGYNFYISTLAEGNGPEGILYSLYEQSIAERAKVTLSEVDIENNKATYGFSTSFVGEHYIISGDNAGKTTYNINCFDVTIKVTYTDEFALTGIEITCDVYTSDPGTLPDGTPNEADIDLDYDPETDTWTFRETALADTYNFIVTQTVGERSEENPNPKKKFVPESFDLFATKNNTSSGYTLTDKITGNLEAEVGSVVFIYVGGYLPEGTSLHYIPEKVSLKLYRNGEEVVNPDYDNETACAMFTFEGDLRNFFIVPKTDGAYKLEIYVEGQLEKEVTIIAGAVDEEHLQLKDNEFGAKVTEAYEWSNEYTFTATTTGKYYFNLPAGVGFINADEYDRAAATNSEDEVTPYFDYYNAKNDDGTYRAGSFSLNLEAGETMRFYVNAVKKGTYVISYAVV